MLELTIKSKANWISKRKFFSQIIISLKSYLVYPFVKKKPEATKKFFSKIYSGIKTDDYIFDSNNELYLEKSSQMFSLLANLINNHIDIVYDCGCGYGSLLKKLNKTQITYDQYIGIDFAQEFIPINKKAQIIKADFCDFHFCDDSKKVKLLVFSNTLCYVSNSQFEKLLERIPNKNTFLLVIEPVPGLFWDATFDNVKLHYRSNKKMQSVFKSREFKCIKTNIDYLIQFGNRYFVPLSYCSLYSNKKI